MAFEEIVKSFDSSSDCVQFISHERCGLCADPVPATNEIGYSGKLPAPAFLYRGERTNAYSSTFSMLNRVMSDRSLPPKCRQTILELGERLTVDIARFLGISPAMAAGLLQHYEYPTRFLDFTANIATAAFFAVQGEVGSVGLVCVLAVQKASALSAILDLTEHPRAARPRRQSGYVVSSPGFPDCKSKAAIEALGLEWFEFTLAREDQLAFGSARGLLDAHSDVAAGILQLCIDAAGKMNDWSAKWLAEHVVAAPFVTQIADPTERIVRLVSALDAGIVYDELVERFNNHRVRSNQFPDTRYSGGFENLYVQERSGRLTPFSVSVSGGLEA
jgi:hypothetical protein